MRTSTRHFIAFIMAVAAMSLFVGGIAGFVKRVSSRRQTSDSSVDQEYFAVWPSNGNGLTMTVMNACDDSWTPIFSLYIYAWNNGSPDALTLSTERAPHDAGDCKAHIGRIKVCNSDYGNTKWAGVAYSFRRSSTGFVTSSTVLLNDYHLKLQHEQKRQYTMCHELGHAFGLPHTDTNHHNADLGNCLDYTLRYHNNLWPGQVNFERLFELYGSAASVDDTANTTNSRSLATVQTNIFDRDHHNQVPSHAMANYNAIVKCLSRKSFAECKKQLPFDLVQEERRMLYSDKKHNGAVQEFSFDGYVIQRHELLVAGLDD